MTALASPSSTPLAPDGLITAEMLFDMPDDVRAELREGKLIDMTAPGSEHGDVTMRLGARIHMHGEDNDLGRTFAAETGFILARDPDTVRAPDIGFVSKARVSLIGTSGYVQCAPDLAVEVLSPSNTSREMLVKIADYFAAGTQRVWVVNPRSRTVTIYENATQDVHVLQASDTLDGDDLLPGFSVPVAKLFR